LKKPAVSVRFRFYKQKTEKPEPNRNWKKPRKKPSQTGKTEKTEPKPRKTEPNRFEPVFSIKNEPNRNLSVWPGFGFFLKKISVWLLFFDKNRTEPKIITPNFQVIWNALKLNSIKNISNAGCFFFSIQLNLDIRKFSLLSS